MMGRGTARAAVGTDDRLLPQGGGRARRLRIACAGAAALLCGLALALPGRPSTGSGRPELVEGRPPAGAAAPASAPGQTIRVACIGDSITQGSGHVAELGKLLGDGYQVVNFGVSGSTLLARGDKPYVKEKAYQSALALKPNVVVIMLGTNDTKPQNYRFIEDWSADCKALIRSFAELQTRPKVYLCLPVPVYFDGNWGIDNGRLLEGVIPGIRKAAAEMGLPLIDTYAPMSNRPELFRDNVHPAGGQAIMAATVYKALTGKDPPTPIPPPPAERTRIACLGDSITEGSGYANALGDLLGNKHIVRNHGVSGSTMLAKGDKPYRKQGKYKALLAFQPHVAIVMLGTNDTKPQNYAHIAEFAADTAALIDELSALETRPRVFLCKPVPVYGKGNFGIDDGRLKEGVIPAIEQVAREKSLPIIDLYAAMSNRPELFKDNVHPAGGQWLMARAVLAVLRAHMPPPAVKDNLLRNPGLEDGPAPWTARGGAVAIISEPVRSGQKALKITGRTANWHGPCQDIRQALAAKGMGYYDVRASVRLSGQGRQANVKVVLMVVDGGGTRYLATRDRPASADDWTDFWDDLMVTWTGELTGALFYVEASGGPEADFVVDDLALCRQAPTASDPAAAPAR